ncbi:MAG TPA: ABC transporter permease [Pseudolabrys sp.]|jgi:ABC-type nitrate/sulfonate/bicarbonate transport system permease component|nr:ABC transporter permease [Pseudolabrys sp.]
MSVSTPTEERPATRAVLEETRTGGALMAASGSLASTVVPIVAIMLLWEVAVRLSHVPPAILPPLSDIFAAIWDMAYTGTLWGDIAATLGRLVESAVTGMIIGTVIGVLMGYFRLWERALVSPMNFLLAIPGTALFPLSMIWFGLSDLAIVSILIYEVALTVMLNTWTGVKTVDLSLVRAGRAFGVSGFALFYRVLIPAALPSIITGYRQAFSRAWRILVVAEMLVSVSAGLGYRIYWAREYFNTDVVFGSLFVVGIVGLLIERVFLRTLEVMTVERWGVMRSLS